MWVQTEGPAEVEVLGCRAPTFDVRGYHYALVEVNGLQPGSMTPYQVRVDGELCWPLPGAAWPDSQIRTRGGTGPVQVVFSSCRHPTPDDAKLAATLGADALAVYAVRMATLPPAQWPDALLLLGDQVYADNPTPQTRRWLNFRRAPRGVPRAFPRGAPEEEVNDFAEYAHLYQEAWAEEEVRWLLSTVPTAMIFDDHDVRDDWNISAAWRRWITSQPWWPARIRGALAAYWVYQHIGNLSPEERHADPSWQAVQKVAGDTWPMLQEMAVAADTDSATLRWSFRWDIDGVRLVMVDTRCGRRLTEGRRAMLDDEQFAWVEDAVSRDPAAVSHLLIGSSVPWLLAPAIHDVQAANEVACARGSVLAERFRQAVDLEHWAAFRRSFDRFAALLRRVAAGPDAPATISVLSGDVHHSYLARAELPAPAHAPVYQVVCSPVHHSVPWYARVLLRAAWFGPLATVVRRVVHRRGLPDPVLCWHRMAGPVFGNAVSTLVLAGRTAQLSIERARQEGSSRRLDLVARTSLTPR